MAQMPDALTQEEREMIDAAVSAGEVTRVPQGASAWLTPVWCDEANQLRYPNGGWRAMAAAKRGRTIAAAKGGRSTGVTDAVRARRARVEALIREGLTSFQIAEDLRVSASVVWNDAKALGLTFRSRPLPPEVAARREAVAAAFDGKRTVPEIARVTGIDHKSVREHLKALGLEAPKGKPGRPAGKSDTMEASS
jgi:hypothetical protein